jgi:hypothetical protein
MRLNPQRPILAAVAAALAVTASFLSGPHAAANASEPTHGVRVGPVDRADGLTGPQLIAQLWRGFCTNDGTQDFSCARLGRTGGVLKPDGQTTCSVEEGTPVLEQLGASCDDVIDPSVDPAFYGATAAAQRRCAVAFDRDFVDGLRITIDDGAPVDIRRPAFEVVTPQQRVWMPEGNFYGISPRAVTFVVHAWAALITGLRPGVHTIAFERMLGGGEPDTEVQTITVVRCHDEG